MKKILVLNSGSSSLKYQLFNVNGENYEVIAKGVADRIGIHNSFVTLKIGENKQTKEVELPTHTEAISEVLQILLSGPLKSMEDLNAIGHRVVHGGETFKSSTIVTDEVIEEMPKTGKYYLSREYVRITNVKDEFRVTRCQREGMETKTLAGTADGMPFEGEVSIKFREHLELKVTKQITLSLDRDTLRTSAV